MLGSPDSVVGVHSVSESYRMHLSLRGVHPVPDCGPDRLRTSHVLTLGSSPESVEKGPVHANRHDLAGTVTERLAAAPAELLDGIADVSLF